MHNVHEHRISKDPNHSKNVEFIKAFYNRQFKPTELTSCINATRNRFLKAIRSYDASLVDQLQNPSLEQLKQLIDKHGIEVISSTHMRAPADELEQIKSQYGINDNDDALKKWKSLRQKYLNALIKAGQKVSDDTLRSLNALRDFAARSGIDISKSRDKAWDVYEKDVAKGAQKFLDSGMIVIDGQPLPDKTCKVTLAGGGLQSDVKVENTSNNKSFFIECKLNFKSARYFKYGVKIRNGRIVYDHKRYIDAAKKNNEDVKKVDELFTKCIDLNSFINDVLESDEVKPSWQEFAKNIDDLCFWLKNGGQYDGSDQRNWEKLVAPYMMKLNEKEQLSFKSGSYPENFKDIVKAFNKYVEYYENGYEDLLKYMVYNTLSDLVLIMKKQDKDFTLDNIDTSASKLRHNVNLSSNDLFKYAAKIQADAKAYHAVADDINASLDDQPDILIRLETGEEIEKIAHQMQRIEAKMNALVRSLEIDANDFDALKSLDEKTKLRCFFKMFVSSTGRKPKHGEHSVIDSIDSSLGNMVICQPTVVENSRLAQMITDFYVKKDGCAYIQIAETAYILDERHNPLGLERLPVFKDVITKFRVALTVPDNLDSIRLSIEALTPDKNAYAGCTQLSFVQRHNDYICKVLKRPVEVKTH